MNTSDKGKPPATNKGVKRWQVQQIASLNRIGVDYLLATTTDQHKVDAWSKIWSKYYASLGKDAIFNLTQRRWRGYETKELPGFTIGYRPRDVMLKLTGETANIVFPLIYPYVNRVARIDLQCTFAFDVAYPELARLFREYLIESGYKATKHPIFLNEDGDTLYLGSMASDHFGRIYDRRKGEGLKVSGKQWRYEVVWRNERATSVFRTIRSCKSGDERVETIHGIVGRWFARKWCELPEAEPPQGVDLISIGANINTSQTRLNWLRSSVRPAIHKLLIAGIDRTDVLDALGLVGLD